MGKKKRVNISSVEKQGQGIDKQVTSEPGGQDCEKDSASGEKTPVFKDPNYLAGKCNGKKPRVWKSLKQIIAVERATHLQNIVSYSSLDAAPSRRPLKKYSDISGLLGIYTDPQTKLRYFNAEEFTRIRMLSPDLVNGYLTLRKANVP
ncbi:INO80 complex subunit C [Tachypleus tridentatus]|uniref:INO80 complex subunit C n=1 Tax=Tachypleus tridentatus TaxID=6853 RepID=UPI003FD26D54